MEQLTVMKSDFSLFYNERNKLYNMFGRNYMEKVPEIYEKLVNILNSDNFFTELIEKRIYDKEYQKTALQNLKLYLLMKLYHFSDEEFDCFKNKKNIAEITDENILKKINIILENPEQSAYLDVLYSITRILFNDNVHKLLQLYIHEKEPALSECEGVKDILQCEFIIERYKQFIDSLNTYATPRAPVIDENGHIIISKGDLFHGTRYSEQVMESIATKGLISGQLIGIPEDGETFFCVDFFKATRNSPVDEVCTLGKHFTNGANQVVFVINHSDIEGSEAMFPNLTDYDAYNETTKEGQKAREIVNVAGLPLNHATGAAILIGVPPCMISSIIINSEIENDSQKVDFISSNFPKATIISRTDGIILRSPAKKYQK